MQTFNCLCLTMPRELLLVWRKCTGRPQLVFAWLTSHSRAQIVSYVGFEILNGGPYVQMVVLFVTPCSSGEGTTCRKTYNIHIQNRSPDPFEGSLFLEIESSDAPGAHRLWLNPGTLNLNEIHSTAEALAKPTVLLGACQKQIFLNHYGWKRVNPS
jgi:hypothetical protein